MKTVNQRIVRCLEVALDEIRDVKAILLNEGRGSEASSLCEIRDKLLLFKATIQNQEEK